MFFFVQLIYIYFNIMENNELIKTLKSIHFDFRHLDCCTYIDVNKMLAKLYFKENEELRAIYHLVEAHAPTLRMQAIKQYDIKRYKQSETSNTVKGISQQYLLFDSDIAKKEEKGILERLREMPKEWTIVQVTHEHVSLNSLLEVGKPKPGRLHISRFPCGIESEMNLPICVTTENPRADEGMPSVLEIVDDAVNKKLTTKNRNYALTRKMRDEAAKQIKAAVNELSKDWLKEWRCLFLGKLCNPSLDEDIRNCIKSITEGKNWSLECCQKLYAIANGSGHLENHEIHSAVSHVIEDGSLSEDIANDIIKFNKTAGNSVLFKRHPVILIIDEKLDLMPWEMISVLHRNPVSRMPSLHFAHALFKDHEKHIVHGNRMINQSDLGFYIINPDNDLGNMEKKLTEFLQKRIPAWKGISGIPPSPDQFASVLEENNLLLYCGHGSGENLLQGKLIEDLHAVAMPLLFGCSSGQLIQPGGMAEGYGTSYNYLLAGSACIVGMLWVVTSDDTDAMTAVLLNNWLPGEPVDISMFNGGEGLNVFRSEPELLRVMKRSRDVAISYSNAAAFVARGIPVKIKLDPK